MPETRCPILRNTTSNFKKYLADSVHKSVNLVAVLPESVGGVEWRRPIGDNGDSGSKRQATLDDLDDLESEVAEYFRNAKALTVWINQKLDDCF